MKRIRRFIAGFLTVCLLAGLPYQSGVCLAEESAAQDDTQDGGQESGGNSGVGTPVINPSGKIVIDSENCYPGMDKSYADGYIPRIENGNACLVVPFITNAGIRDNRIRVALDLGDTDTMPFVCKNYEKMVALQNAAVNGGGGMAESYVVCFNLELKGERVNGSYPVGLKVSAVDVAGNEINQEFVVYVTITDGKNTNAETEQEPEVLPVLEEAPTFAPKIMIQSYQYSKDNILAGDEVTAEITLYNTSRKNVIKNMTVTVSASNEYITLLDASDTVYVDEVGTENTCTVAYSFRVNEAAPQGQYELALSMDYADADGNTYTGNGKAKLFVEQTLEMQFDQLIIPPELQVAETVEVSFQAMNLGRSKVYNVRAVVEADGLKPQGTIFIGDMEPGTSAAGSTQVSVSSLSGDNMYGKTEGTVIFYYEDAMGNEQTEEKTFSTVIKSPFRENTDDKEPDKPEQWWAIMAVVGGILLLFVTVIIVGKARRKKQDE